MLLAIANQINRDVVMREIYHKSLTNQQISHIGRRLAYK
jgi:hypothetical protein